MPMGKGKFKRRQQPGIFRDIVGPHAKKLAQLGQNFAVMRLNDHAVTRWTRIAAGPAIRVRGHPAGSLGACTGFTGKHGGLRIATGRAKLLSHLRQFSGFRVAWVQNAGQANDGKQSPPDCPGLTFGRFSRPNTGENHGNATVGNFTA